MDKQELDIIKEQLETRSEEVQEIMGFIPNWLIRWGITVIFVTVLVLLIGSYFFKYPDILNATITVTSKNPPANIVARSSGKFEQIFIKDGDMVKANELLALIKNTCKYKDFIALKNFLKNFSLENREIIKKNSVINIKKSLALGELQTAYESFFGTYRNYLYFINNKSFEYELKSLKNQRNKKNLLLKQAIEQKKIQAKELVLYKKKYNRAGKLKSEGIISKEQFDNAEGIYLQKEYGYKSAETQCINLDLQIEILKGNIKKLKTKFEYDKKQLLLNLRKNYKNLNSAISLWEQKYCLKSPMKGRVVFTKYWNKNQNVRAGDIVLTLIPETKSELIGRVLLPVTGSGKIKIGQGVNVKFNSYPFMEYGMVRGIVKNKSVISSNDKYILEIGFPNGLNTSYKKELKFNQEMKGIAEIITEDTSLLERLFQKLRSILKK